MKTKQNNLLKSRSTLTVKMLTILTVTTLLQSCGSVSNLKTNNTDLVSFKMVHKSSSMN